MSCKYLSVGFHLFCICSPSLFYPTIHYNSPDRHFAFITSYVDDIIWFHFSIYLSFVVIESLCRIPTPLPPFHRLACGWKITQKWRILSQKEDIVLLLLIFLYIRPASGSIRYYLCPRIIIKRIKGMRKENTG